MIGAFILVGIIGVLIIQILLCCNAYHEVVKKEIKNNTNNVIEVSLEEVMDFVKETIKNEDDTPLDQLFIKWLNEEDKPNLTETSSKYVEVDNGECKGYECACSPQREDCCKSTDNKRCVFKININKLCGIEEYIKNPELVTKDEADLLTQVLITYEKLKEAK